MAQKKITVALVGNPNTGKSTLFNAISGLNQRTGNYPGVTVELKKGTCTITAAAPASSISCEVDLIDLPGTYSLAPRSPDEMVSVDLLLGRRAEEQPPDLIISVVDASNLDRHLYLTSQLLSIGKPVLLAINMIDIAKKNGIEIDATALSEKIGLPVIKLRANSGEGVDELKQAIAKHVNGPKPNVKLPSFPPAFYSEVSELQKTTENQLPTFLVERLLLDINGSTEQWAIGKYGSDIEKKLSAARTRLSEAGHGIPAMEAKARFQWVREIVSVSVRKPIIRAANTSDKIDRILTHRFWGTLAFLLVMFLLFQSIFVAANPLMDSLKWLQEQLIKLIEAKASPGPLRSLVTDGVIKGVGTVIVFLPQILILFGVIAILEDCGYMARAAYLMDKFMSKCGLSGKSFIPLLSSVACAVPGIMATRVIENRRDRFATMIIAPLMSCSARLPVYSLLIGAFLTVNRPIWLPGLVLFALYMIGFTIAPIVAFILKRTVLKGETPVFVMELPVYKWPSLSNILRRMCDAAWAFIKRAGTLILATMILIWALTYFPATKPDGTRYETELQKAEEAVEALGDNQEAKEAKEKAEAKVKSIKKEWRENSYLGKLGHFLEPVTRPLGWDWKITTATLASFPAREVIVGTLGLIYEQEAEDKNAIGEAMKNDWANDPIRSKYAVPVACSVLVFFALCCQCASTLAVIRRETKSWRWPIATFIYMTVLAYIGAFLTFQIGKWIVG